MLSKLRRFFRKVRRSWDYAVLGWANYDWDYAYLLELLRFKLERMHKFMNSSNAMASHSKETIQSLRLAAKLSRKLCADSYSFFLDRHSKKWGDVKVFEHVEPSEDEKRRGIAHITRFNSTPETAQEREEFLAAATADDNMRKRDARWLFSIMEKYHENWWD